MLYKLLDLTVKPFLKLIIVLSFSLALYIPETSHVKSWINPLHLQQGQTISSKFKIDPLDAIDIVHKVSTVSSLQGIQPSHIYAMIEQESSFNKYAVSDKGKAKCLLQVHPSSGYTVNTTDIESCLLTGTNILLNFQDKFGNLRDATKAYYCGNNIKRKSCNKYLQGVESKKLKYNDWI